MLIQQDQQDSPENEQDDCIKDGLVRFLIGMSIPMSEDIVSATIAHLLICQHRSRFTFLHEFHDVL
jgi:hypothetical protein